MSVLPERFDYRPRVVDDEVERRLRLLPTVLVEGSRGCGKTTTARRLANRELLLDQDANARSHASHGTLPLDQGPFPLLIDEWQLAPQIWNRVRRASDDLQGPGRFILTGSANPTDDITRHSGAGRVARVRMRPMSLYESGASTGAVSLASLLSGGVCSAWQAGGGQADAELSKVIEALCRGGWPACRAMSVGDAQEFLGLYLEEICRVDVPRVNGTGHDPASVRRTIVSLARHSAASPSGSTLASDVGGGRPIAYETLAAYLDALERIFIVEDQPAWSPHLASRSRLRKAPKRHLADPALAACALGAGPQRLFDDREMLGHLFESMVVRDLRVYAQASAAEVFHFLDSNRLEVDAIVQRADGAWLAAEVKLGQAASVDAAAKSLLKLRDRVDTQRMGEPAKLLVVTATGYAYERSDGVAVAPLALLGP